MSKSNSTLYDGEEKAVMQAREYTKPKELPDPYRAYSSHKTSAKIRGIEWGFTFTSWWEIWQPYYHMRGRETKNHLCMAREKDEGPYAPGNVYLTTIMGNIEDYHRRNPARTAERQRNKEAKEMRFARSGPSDVGMRNAVRSQSVKISQHGATSTCNYRDELLQWELLAL